MREFDERGLLLANAQSNLFVETVDRYSGSSDMVIKQFMNSDICYAIDKYDDFYLDEIIHYLDNNGLVNRGSRKYTEKEMA